MEDTIRLVLIYLRNKETQYIEDTYLFEVNTKYISSSEQHE